MTRKVFMEQLERLLISVPEGDKKDAIIYYTDYFEDAGITEDMEVPTSVGTPDQIAKRIMKDLGVNNNNYYGDNNKTENNNYYYGDVNSNNTKAANDDKTIKLLLAILIAVVTFPVWSGVILSIAGIIFGIVVGLAGGIIGCGIAGVVVIITAFTPVAAGASATVFVAGAGILLLGIALLLIIPETLFCIRFLPWVFGLIVSGVNKLTGKEGR